MSIALRNKIERLDQVVRTLAVDCDDLRKRVTELERKAKQRKAANKPGQAVDYAKKPETGDIRAGS